MVIHFKSNKPIYCRVNEDASDIVKAASNSKECRLVLEFLDEGVKPQIGRIEVGKVDRVEFAP